MIVLKLRSSHCICLMMFAFNFLSSGYEGESFLWVKHTRIHHACFSIKLNVDMARGGSRSNAVLRALVWTRFMSMSGKWKDKIDIQSDKLECWITLASVASPFDSRIIDCLYQENERRMFATPMMRGTWELHIRLFFSFTFITDNNRSK